MHRTYGTRLASLVRLIQIRTFVAYQDMNQQHFELGSNQESIHVVPNQDNNMSLS